MKNISNQNIIFKDKKVLLRVDLNVPMKNGSITESSRIEKIIPTIKLLIDKKAKIIILSHIGRPKGNIVEGMSLEPISKKLSSILNKEITFSKKTMNNISTLDINKIKSGSILMLENIRFNRGEETNDIEFSNIESLFYRQPTHIKKVCTLHFIIMYFDIEKLRSYLETKENTTFGIWENASNRSFFYSIKFEDYFR